jgi:hypothetical protein
MVFIMQEGNRRNNPLLSEYNPVEVGMCYEPSLLPDFSTDYFDLLKNKLFQHATRDINNELIPAWTIEQGLRPGTVVIVSATLHIFNIKDKKSDSFRRVSATHLLSSLPL